MQSTGSTTTRKAPGTTAGCSPRPSQPPNPALLYLPHPPIPVLFILFIHFQLLAIRSVVSDRANFELYYPPFEALSARGSARTLPSDAAPPPALLLQPNHPEAEGDGRLTVVPTLDTFQAAIQAGAGSVMCSCEGEPS